MENKDMNNSQIKRRNFFKKAGVFLSGVILFMIRQWLPRADSPEKQQTSLKEAMHYKTDDTLAG
jgi:hypothetical protein